MKYNPCAFFPEVNIFVMFVTTRSYHFHICQLYFWLSSTPCRKISRHCISYCIFIHFESSQLVCFFWASHSKPWC